MTGPSKKSSFHKKARQLDYGRGAASRLPISDDKVSWNNHSFFYDPPVYTSPTILGKGVMENNRFKIQGPVWADPSDFQSIKNFNQTRRKSYEGKYYVSQYNLPYNPRGRTGLQRNKIDSVNCMNVLFVQDDGLLLFG